VRRDPGARALAEHLSPTEAPAEQAATVQQVSVSGKGHVVIVANKDIRGLSAQVLPKVLKQMEARATGEATTKGGESLTQLRQILVTRFDAGELRTLCFDLGIDYDDLPGEGKANKARELVAYLNRRGRISELLKVGEQLRPDVSWK